MEKQDESVDTEIDYLDLMNRLFPEDATAEVEDEIEPIVSSPIIEEAEAEEDEIDSIEEDVVSNGEVTEVWSLVDLVKKLNPITAIIVFFGFVAVVILAGKIIELLGSTGRNPTTTVNEIKDYLSTPR